MAVFPSGGKPGYTYLWNDVNASTTSNVTLVCAGTYEVIVKDAVGCTEKATVTIGQPTPLIVSTVQESVTCFNGSDGTGTATVIGGTPPYTYSWSPTVPGTAQITAMAGLYTVNILDANNCPALKDVTILQPDEINPKCKQLL